MRGRKKDIERVVLVAFPAAPLFGFGLARAPRLPQGLDRKNTIVGKVREKYPYLPNTATDP